jgi:hypothetical protein
MFSKWFPGGGPLPGSLQQLEFECDQSEVTYPTPALEATAKRLSPRSGSEILN